VYSTALITGASSGLGRGLALHFAAQGTKVYAAARRKPELEALAKENPNIVPLVLDVSEAATTFAAVQKVDSECGGLELVIANAGIADRTPGKRIDWPTLERVIDINVKGACATLTGAMPGMVTRGKGHLVATSSLAALIGLPRIAGYCASKAFLATFMDSMRLDLEPLGIHVTCLHPGYVKTDLTAKNKGEMPFLMELEPAVKKMASAIERRLPSYAFPWQLATALKTVRTLPRGLEQAAARRMV
jgi:NADP-dependent 3-hydroxy acid dehydrogenase YdfG